MKSILDTFLPYQRDFFLANAKRKLWLASRQVGKSFTLAGILNYKALSTPNGLSLCISTGARAASEIIKKCVMFAEAVKCLSKGTITYTSSFDKIQFSNGCRIVSLPGSTDGANLRGYSATCVVCDEACFIPHLEDLVQAIAPTLTRNKDAELILASTPGGRAGYFYDKWQTGGDDWHRQMTTIDDAISLGLDVDKDELRKLCPDEQAFRQEYMCEWAAQDQGILEGSNLEVSDEIPPGGYHVFGMDVGRTKDRSAIAVIKVCNDKLYLVDLITLQDTPYAVQKARVAQIKKQYNICGGYLDSTGIGSAFAEDINHTLDSRFRGLQFTAANKTPMYEALRAKIFDRKFFVASELLKQVSHDLQMTRRIVDDAGKVVYRADRDSSGHADAASALVLAVKAAHDFRQGQSLPHSFGGLQSRFR